MSNIYINAVKQISVQQPLVDDWFERPCFYSDPYIRAIEPDYKQFFTPNEARRFGNILKRALVVSRQAMSESGVLQPDAIITGTGLGCIEYTKIFLDKLVREGEELLNPTYFMQSTHNTISSLAAIDAKCHAYNNTYSHKGISFECALQDAFIQLQRNKAFTALVGAHDEMIPVYFLLLKKAGYLGKPNQVFAGEAAVAMMLSTEKTEKTLCEIEAVEMVYKRQKTEDRRHETRDMRHEAISNLKSQVSKLKISNLDYIMVGTNGDEENDKIYFENCAELFPNIPLLQYKNVFGESYTAPALGVYAAALCLQRGEIPDHLKISDYQFPKNKINKILCYNHFENKNHTFILLSK